MFGEPQFGNAPRLDAEKEISDGKRHLRGGVPHKYKGF